MENTQITLNGTDWSNLYHVEYSPGSGGEKLAEIFAIKGECSHCKQVEPHNDSHKYIYDDSFYSAYTTPYFQPWLKPYTYKSRIPLDKHTLIDMSINLKLIDYFRHKIDKKTDEDIHVDKTDYTKIAAGHKVTDNVVLRTHYRNRDYQRLKNAKSIRIYPIRQGHLVVARMFIRRWLVEMDIEGWGLREVLGDKYMDYAENYYKDYGGVKYQWQQERLLHQQSRFYSDIPVDLSYQSFVIQAFNDNGDLKAKEVVNFEADDYAIPIDNIISANEWIFGTATRPLRQVYKYTGVHIEDEYIKNWQKENRNEIINIGLDPEVKDNAHSTLDTMRYFLKYYD